MTEEIKALLKAAKTEEEAKEILLAHKNELTDEELEEISGGYVAGYSFGLFMCNCAAEIGLYQGGGQ